jgi:methyl-accepting chemotaxis protein
MKAVLDWFIPESLRQDRDTLSQARAMVAIFFNTLIAAPAFGILEYRMGLEGLVGGDIFILVGITVATLVLKLTGSFAVARQIAVASTFGFFAHGALITGGIHSFQTLWLLVFPLLAVFIAGRVGGLIWGLVDLLAIILIGNVKPESLGLTPVTIAPELLESLSFYTCIFAVSLVTILASLFESSKAAGYRELDVERASAETLAEQVSHLLKNVSTALVAVDRESSSIAGTAQSIAGSMVKQVSQAQQVSTSMENFHARIAESAEASMQAAQEASVAGERAASSGKIMTEAINDMRRVSDMVAEAAVKIEELTRRSDEISNIVGVIREIADQTNLLALNAAIEAARAGEQGRGFAVVADEVRKLAERTQSSTGEIGERVSSILGVTQQAMQSMTQATDLMQKGRDNAMRADESLQDIISRSGTVAVVLRQLADSGQAQTQANAQMAQRIGEIREAIGGAHDSTSQIAEATRRLELEIRQLSDTANALHRAA